MSTKSGLCKKVVDSFRQKPKNCLLIQSHRGKLSTNFRQGHGYETESDKIVLTAKNCKQIEDFLEQQISLLVSNKSSSYLLNNDKVVTAEA